MKTCSIDGTSMMNYGCILVERQIAPPTPNLQYVEIPGKDGKLDITDFVGLTFQNRIVSMKFGQKKKSNFVELRQQIEALNGKRVTVVFSDASEVNWKGRLTITEYDYDETGKLFSIAMELDADPFPYDSSGGVLKNV